MSAFVGFARPRSSFAPAATARPPGFTAGIGARAVSMPIEAPAATRQTTVEPAVAVPSPEPVVVSAAEAEFSANEALRAREHQMLVAELEAERKRLRDASARLGQLAGELTRVRGSLLAEMRAQAGDVLLAGAQALATRALVADPALLLAMVDEAVATLGGSGVTVRVNPVDVERVSGAFGGAATVIADEGVHAGCICEGATGTIDRRFDTANAALVAETTAWKKTA